MRCWRPRIVVACAAAMACAFGPRVDAAPVHYAVPEEVATLIPGPGLETVQANCGACHSADYITTQPRGFADPTAFWTAEVTKMRKAYGAPIDDGDIGKIVAYLASTYGKPGAT